MKDIGWQVRLGIGLLLLSLSGYIIHYIIFRDPHHIFIYLIGDIAFVFFQVLLVTLIIHHLLDEREKKKKIEKLSIVIGVFFSETGTQLLRSFLKMDQNLNRIRKELIVTDGWSNQNFSRVKDFLKEYDYNISINKIDFSALKKFLVEKRDFLLRLLENPVLLEHEKFTELLQSVFHLTEELTYRETLTRLPDSDYEHLAGDIRRCYTLLVHEWLDYMEYLEKMYPYLFSLSVRTNPFDKDASPIVN